MNKLQRANKYKAKRCQLDGEWFDSKAEARRWCELQLAERAGEITQLERQVVFELKAFGGGKVAEFIVDYAYYRDGAYCVEDCKSPATQKLDYYRLKKRFLKAQYGLDLIETGRKLRGRAR